MASPPPRRPAPLIPDLPWFTSTPRVTPAAQAVHRPPAGFNPDLSVSHLAAAGPPPGTGAIRRASVASLVSMASSTVGGGVFTTPALVGDVRRKTPVAAAEPGDSSWSQTVASVLPSVALHSASLLEKSASNISYAGVSTDAAGGAGTHAKLTDIPQSKKGLMLPGGNAPVSQAVFSHSVPSPFEHYSDQIEQIIQQKEKDLSTFEGNLLKAQKILEGRAADVNSRTAQLDAREKGLTHREAAVSAQEKQTTHLQLKLSALEMELQEKYDTLQQAERDLVQNAKQVEAAQEAANRSLSAREDALAARQAALKEQEQQTRRDAQVARSTSEEERVRALAQLKHLDAALATAHADLAKVKESEQAVRDSMFVAQEEFAKVRQEKDECESHHRRAQQGIADTTRSLEQLQHEHQRVVEATETQMSELRLVQESLKKTQALEASTQAELNRRDMALTMRKNEMDTELTLSEKSLEFKLQELERAQVAMQNKECALANERQELQKQALALKEKHERMHADILAEVKERMTERELVIQSRELHLKDRQKAFSDMKAEVDQSQNDRSQQLDTKETMLEEKIRSLEYTNAQTGERFKASTASIEERLQQIAEKETSIQERMVGLERKEKAHNSKKNALKTEMHEFDLKRSQLLEVETTFHEWEARVNARAQDAEDKLRRAEELHESAAAAEARTLENARSLEAMRHQHDKALQLCEEREGQTEAAHAHVQDLMASARDWEVVKSNTEHEIRAQWLEANAAREEAEREKSGLEASRESLVLVEQALDAREEKLKDSWRLLQEKGVLSSRDDKTRQNGILSLLLEDAATAKAQATIPDMSTPYSKQYTVESRDVLLRRRAVMVQRETLLQRWALALEMTAAKQGTLEGELQQARQEAEKTLAMSESVRKKQRSVEKRERVLEKERERVQDMMDQVTKRAEALYTAEVQHQARVTTAAEELTKFESQLKEQEALVVQRSSDAEAAYHEASHNALATREGVDVLDEREQKLNEINRTVATKLEELRDKEMRIKSRDKRQAQLEKELKQREIQIAGREAAQTEIEKEMARAIEQNHSNAEQLESQISALELERARISEGKSNVLLAAEKLRDAEAREADALARESYIKEHEQHFKRLVKQHKRQEQELSEQIRNIDRDKKQLRETQATLADKERAITVVADTALTTQAEVEAAMKRAQVAVRDEAAELSAQKQSMLANAEWIKQQRSDLVKRLEEAKTRENSITDEQDKLNKERYKLEVAMEELRIVQTHTKEAEERVLKSKEEIIREKLQVDEHLAKAREEARKSRTWLRSQQTVMKEQLDNMLHSKAEGSVNLVGVYTGSRPTTTASKHGRATSTGEDSLHGNRKALFQDRTTPLTSGLQDDVSSKIIHLASTSR